MAHSAQNPAWSQGLSATVAAESKHKMHGLTITLWLRISSSFSGLQHIRWVYNVNCNTVKVRSHLSKGTSGHKQKCTQTQTSFLSTVFHALPHGVIGFVRSVSPRIHFLTGGNSLTANQKLLLSWFSKPTVRAKWIPPCERA